MSINLFVKLDNKWKSVESLISNLTGSPFSFDSSKTYQIEARGLGYSYLIVSDSKPSNQEDGGVMLDKFGEKSIEYKKGSKTLYARSDKSSFLNITIVGEE